MPLFSNAFRFTTAGLGLSLGALILALDDPRSGRLILPFGTTGVMRTRFRHHLVWPAGRRLTRLQRDFRDWLEHKSVDRWAALIDLIGPEAARGLRHPPS